MDEIDTLCLSGGALKGLCYIGMLKYFMEKDVFKNIKAFYGVSVGALACLLFLLGYSYKELKTIILQIEFTSLVEPCFENFITNFGINKGEKMDNFIKVFIDNKGYHPDITMKGFYEKTGKHFCCVTTDVNLKKEVYVSHENFPELELWKAVRMSCSIPVVFEPVVYKGVTYVDGFLTENVPLPETPGKNILCVVLNTPPSAYDLTNLGEYMYALIKVVLGKLHENILEKIDKTDNRIMYFTAMKTDSVNFKISKQEKNKLVISGYEQTKAFFEKEFSKQ